MHSRIVGNEVERPWQAVREGVHVKLLPRDKELYALAQSTDWVKKERAMRRRQLKGLVSRLKALREMDLSRDQLLLKLGAAKAQFRPAGVWSRFRCPKKESRSRR
jgi:hypothetical protein